MGTRCIGTLDEVIFGILMHWYFCPKTVRHYCTHLGPCPLWACSWTYAKCCRAHAGILKVCDWLFHMHVAVLALSPSGKTSRLCWKAGRWCRSPLQVERMFIYTFPSIQRWRSVCVEGGCWSRGRRNYVPAHFLSPYLNSAFTALGRFVPV